MQDGKCDRPSQNTTDTIDNVLVLHFEASYMANTGRGEPTLIVKLKSANGKALE